MTEKIVSITLDNTTLIMRNDEIAREKERALNDILEHNNFSLKENPNGPYHIYLSSAEKKLLMNICKEGDTEILYCLPLKVAPFRRIMRDYHLICESYMSAVESANPAKIEAIDMGRRGLHNEGAEMLQEQLEDTIECDFETIRRLFTLISVFHMR